MNFRLIFISTGIVLLSMSFQGNAQNLKVKDSDAWKYMHMLSSDEMDGRNEIGKYFQATDPPPTPAESLAEFEPMAGALIRYPFGINKELIKALGRKDTLYTIVKDSSELQVIRGLLVDSYVIPNERCKFIVVATDSYWTRDYGPMYTAGIDSIGITDFIYNRPRPNDDKIPQVLASKYGFPYYSMNVVHSGGNYMTDGYGVAASTPIVYSESLARGVVQEEVEQQMKDYLGIQTYHVIEDPNGPYSINHIDCWGKFLDVDKVLIRSVPESHPQYNEIEAIAWYFKNQKSSWGNNYQVFRVYTPNNEPYTNSFILNKRIYVPIMLNVWDDEALQSYKNAMPGYEITGYMGEWASTDALHCRVHEMADKYMIRIKHIPIRGAQGEKTDFTIEANIKAYSGKPLIADSVRVYYKTNNSIWLTANMQHDEGNTYSAQLPHFEKDQEIKYFIKAVDEVGKHAELPIVGAADPFTFTISGVPTETFSEIASNKIKVYPNPVGDWLSISVGEIYSSNEIQAEVYSVSGQHLTTDRMLNTSVLKINFRNLKPGIYLMRISYKGKVETVKVVRQ